MRSSLRLSIILNAGIKVAALVVSFVSTPLMMSFFSDESVVGVWFTILSVLNWISFFDFGIGNGLRNDLTYALALGDVGKTKTVITSSFCLLLIVVLALLPVSIFISFTVDWNGFFSIGADAVNPDDLSICMAVVLSGTLLQLLFKLVNSLLYAAQKNVAPSLLLLLSNVLILLAVFLPPSLADSGDKLIYMSFVEVSALSLPLFIAGLLLFLTTFKQFVPSASDIDGSYFKVVGSSGFQFFVIQLALLVVSSTNEMFIGKIYGSGDVVPYSVAFRIFNFIITFFSVMAQPIWSDMASSYASGSRQRLLTVHRKYLVLALAASTGAISLGLVVNPVLRIWLSDQAPVLTGIEITSLVLLVSATVLTNAETCLGNATNRLLPQLIFYTFAALAKYPIALLLSNVISGWASVVMSNALVLIPVLMTQHFSNNRFFAKMVMASGKGASDE